VTPESVPDPFVRTPEGHLVCDLGHAVVRFTGRNGGTSSGPYASLNLGSWGDDDPETVRENRAILARFAGVGPERLAQARQVHASDVLVIGDDADLPGADLARARDADGVATARAGVPCVVLCADCVPVALVSDRAVAMIHAGWRGLVGGVIEAGLRALAEASGDVGGGARTGAVTAVIGPSAGPCCYEVGDEVHAALEPSGAAAGTAVRVGNHADLWAAAAARLRAAGVEHVLTAGECTICDPGNYFSHRRDAGTTGRQAGMVWLS
jgi:YfiH family protein